MKFILDSPFKPAGGQPEAISALYEGYSKYPRQTLEGITGSGKSLDYNELILVKDNFGNIQKVKIGEYVEAKLPKKGNSVEHSVVTEVSGGRVLSFNISDFKVDEAEITQVSKHSEKFVYEITLDDNSAVRVTKDHNCFRLKNAALELCSTQKLKIGDHLPASNAVPIPANEINAINLLDYSPQTNVSISGLIDKLKISESLLANFLKKEYRAPKWKFNQIVQGTKERSIPAPLFLELLAFLNLNVVDANDSVKLVSKGSDILPPIIQISNDFLVFMGLYVAEGHNAGQYVLISNSDRKLQETCMRFWKNLGLHCRIRNKNDIEYSSVLMARFFGQFGKKAPTKKVPNFVYNFSNAQLSVFLSSMFDGDGWAEDGRVMYCSASKELIFDVKNLLLRFGITSRMQIKPNKKYKRNYFNLSISGKENLESFKNNINFSIGYKKEKLSATIKDDANTNVDLFPALSGFIKEIKGKYSLSQEEFGKIINSNQSYISMLESNKRGISKNKFALLATWLEKKDKKYASLKNLLKFNYRKIVSIKKVKSTTGFVYDLSARGNENFAAGFGNIFVHNTFVMANLIEKVQKPTLVLAHNKTLAAQLYTEFKELFPKNRVEYFISYYDYYQPESYMPASDVYIEKESTVNEQIEKMRLHATASLMSRDDVIVVASISCIYGLGNPEDFRNMSLILSKGKTITRSEIIRNLVEMQYERNDQALEPGKFRVRGETIDIIPSYEKDIIRLELAANSIGQITEIDSITANTITTLDEVRLFPARQFVVPIEKQQGAIDTIKAELEQHLPSLGPLEFERLKKRVNYDMEMIKEMGFCSGIENYSRHFDGRKMGEPPFVLLDYFPKDFFLIVDESHQTIPQSRAMFNGDFARKKNLVDFGFRLPSAFDNRPLKFDEFEKYFHHTLFVSATPAEYEKNSSGQVVPLIIRPTGLLDPLVEVRPIKNQVADMLSEIANTTKLGERVLITTLTKRMAEDLTDYLAKENIKVRYMHSEIESLERIELIRQLRSGEFDVLVGINLLREGLDIPEVRLICILDADKEGFLRDERSLIQTIGRASRNLNGKVILYADVMTKSIKGAVEITRKRRETQERFNKLNNITPMPVVKKVAEKKSGIKGLKHMGKTEIVKKIAELDAQMRKSAEDLDFEKAIAFRDALEELKGENAAMENSKDYRDTRGKKEKVQK